MKQYVKTEDPSFVRDPSSTAILNIDKVAYRRFREERERLLEIQRTIAGVQTLRGEMSQIKQLLLQLVNGKTNG